MAKEESQNIISRGFGFFGESWTELKKVHTPTRQETMMLTVRVFALIGLFGVFLGLTDLLVGMAMQYILT